MGDRTRGRRRASLIHLPEHDIERAEDDDRVRDIVAHSHLLERGEVTEGRRTELHPVGLVAALRETVDAVLALGSFGAEVALALIDAKRLRQVRVQDEALFRHQIEALLDYLAAL